MIRVRLSNPPRTTEIRSLRPPGLYLLPPKSALGATQASELGFSQGEKEREKKKIQGKRTKRKNERERILPLRSPLSPLWSGYGLVHHHFLGDSLPFQFFSSKPRGDAFTSIKKQKTLRRRGTTYYRWYVRAPTRRHTVEIIVS